MSAKVLILGSGSREHALAWKLAQSPKVELIYVAPGNGGTDGVLGKTRNLGLNVKNNEDVLQWCLRERPSLVVVGPEDPLNNGVADVLRAAGFACYGPSKDAAQIECDKAFAKDFMSRQGIPTARYRVFTDAKEAKEFALNPNFNAKVVKASGLAAGKGVIVANDVQEVVDQLDVMLTQKAFGSAGEVVVLEELLEGPEVSVLAFSDGKTISVMPPAQDHKRAYDNDEGPNTGGMGAYCPCPLVSEQVLSEIKENVLQKAIDGLRQEGKPFVGTLYAGLMLTADGPKALEYNCRFGDPETQSILPLLETDLYDVLLACTNETLADLKVNWKKNTYACGVVIASGGYPASATKGVVIEGLEQVLDNGLLVFQAGTAAKDGKLYTAGGRVLSVVALADDLRTAAANAQVGAHMVKIEKSFFRKDIAKKALERIEAKLDYKSSGVNIDAGNQLVDRIKALAKSTNRAGVIGAIGGFGGLFDLKAAGYHDPILVSGTDGVGTKLKIALECRKYDTVGIDLVAMCVNDVLVQGAEPLYFLDYFACGKLDVNVAAAVISGVAAGCKESDCALIGGETAEMPGMYSSEDFDLAGFAVGAVNRKSVLPKIEDIEIGDCVIGLPSSGVHSNGFSLVRKLIELRGISLNHKTPFDSSLTFGEALLTPTRLYIRSLLPIIKMGFVTALSHITGGGLLENIPRVLPEDLAVQLNAAKWSVPPIFKWIHREGNVEEHEMLKTFNCGIGMVCIVKKQHSELVLNALKLHNEADASIIGQVVRRTGPAVTVEHFATAFDSNANVATNRVKRVAVLISGSGTNLQALIDHTMNRANNSCAKIVLVISNVDKVEGLRRAERAGIPTKVILSKGLKRAEFDKLVHEELLRANIEIVCLAGFMRIITEEFVNNWMGRMINVHPSILPSFKGMHTHKQALESGVRVHGCTVHFVDNDVDTGAIILQGTVPVLIGDTETILQERVKQQEHKIFPQAMEYLSSEKVTLTSAGKVEWHL